MFMVYHYSKDILTNSHYFSYRCRLLYALKLAFPEKDSKIRLETLYDDIVDEINLLGFRVKCVVADAPKRCSLRQTQQFNGTYGMCIIEYSFKCTTLSW